MMNKEIYDAIDKSKITRSYKRILVGLVSFHLRAKAIYGSYEYYAKNWGNMNRKTVQRGIKFLEKTLKIIEVNRSQGTTNKITFIVSMDELVTILKDYTNEKGLSENVQTQEESVEVEMNVQKYSSYYLTKGQNVQTSEDKMSSYIESITETNNRNNTVNATAASIEKVGFSLELDNVFSSTLDITYDDWSSKQLQQNGISPKETLSLSAFNYLVSMEDLNNYLNSEKKIQYSYWKGRYYLMTSNGEFREEPIPEPPFGFDARVFQSVRIDGNEIINTNGDEIKLGNAQLIVQFANGELNSTNCKEYDLKKLRELVYLAQR